MRPGARYALAPMELDEEEEDEAELRPPSSWPRARLAAVAALALSAAAAAVSCWRRPAAARGLEVSDVAGLAEDRSSTCGLIEDGIEYHTTTIRGRAVQDITTQEMCCAVCEGDPSCGAWTWGKQRGIVGLTDVCYLKDFPGGAEIVKLERPEVVSGMPARGVQKHGMMAGLRAQQRLNRGEKPPEEPGVLPNETCLGRFHIAGHRGNLSVAALPNPEGGRVDALEGRWLVPHLQGKAYFMENCQARKYASMSLLGKTLRYTTDVSGAGCGCDATLRLVVPGRFDSDHDSEGANFRVDIQGGNQYAWSTQVHVKGDVIGMSVGYGGGGDDWSGKRDWTGDQFGPGGACIDTSKPFEVAASFPVDGLGILSAVEVTLSQFGRHCPLTVRAESYKFEGKDGLIALSREVAAGMTPSITYEASDDILWLDGIGTDGKGPCVQDVPEECPQSVRFYDFSISYVGEEPRTGARPAASALVEGSVGQAVKHLMRDGLPDSSDQRGGLIVVAEDVSGRAGARGQAPGGLRGRL